MDTRASRNPLRVLPVAFALIFNVLIGPMAPVIGPAMSGIAAAADAPVITQDTTVNGCNGVVSTPGSENTDKRFVSGSLEPGGTATFEISYPVDPADVAGRTEFEITDCVFISDSAVAKYFIHFVPNTENFLLTFTLNVPADAPIGSEYCNYAKTTAAPSQSQASNRKAGPACFIVGGALRVLKVDGGGSPLPGATFDIDCDFPTSTAALATTVISAPDDGSVSDGKDANTSNDVNESFNSTSGGSLNVSATTGSDGAIDVQAPVGTACTFTETAAPAGYLLPADTDAVLTVVAGEQKTATFVNVRENPVLEVSKTADHDTVNAGEQIGFNIDVDSTGTTPVKAATLSDLLPAGDGVSWSINPAYAGPGTCAISGAAGSQVLGCSFGDLAAGAGASVHVVSATNADSCGAYANTATADGSNVEAITANDTTTVECADLDLQKTPDGASVNAGDEISFTLTLTNNGDGAATNVDIDDTLPAGFTWSEDPDRAECSISGGKLHCDIASLASGASFSVTVSAPTDAADCSAHAYVNHATADADNHAAVNDDGDVTIQCADVSVEKSGNGPIDAGDTATYTIVVSAGGTTASTNVTLSDDLPAGVSWQLGGADAADCSIDTSADPDGLSCDFGTMAPGTSKTITVSGTADRGECPSISNTAEVDSDFDTNASNDSSTASITVNCGNVVLTKSPDLPSDNGGTVNAGSVATFTINLQNTGSGAARGVHVEDQLPDVSGTWAVDNANCSIDGSNLLTCNLPDMAAGASVTLHLTTTVGSADCGVLDNPLASVSTSNDGSSQDSGAITVTCPELSISKTTDTPVVTAGGVAHYTITVDNSAGSGSAKGVTISDALPAGLTWSENSGDCSISGSTLSCGPVDIAAGASFSVTLSGTTDAGDCPSISNSVSYDSANAGSGSTASHPTVITVNCPDASVEKSAGDARVNAGDSVSYDLVVHAGGSGDSTNVMLTDELPVGIDWSLSGDDMADCAIDTSGMPQVLGCDFGTLHAGESRSVTVSGQAGPEDCGTLENSASVDADVDVNARNDSAGPVSVKVSCPNVSIEKSGSGVVSAGDAIHYTIEASNDGEGDAYGFELSDTLPAVDGGWTLGAGAPAFCELDGNDLSCALEVFEAGDSFSVTLNAVSSNADCGDLENTAFVSATNEAASAGDDNQSSHTITVDCPNLEMFKSADAGTVSAGDAAAYTIVVTNHGPGTAKNVHLDEQLPAGVEWNVSVEEPAPAGGCVSSDGSADPQSITCDFASLADGASVTIHLSGETDAADCGTLHNVAMVSAANEDPAQLDDNSASADVVVECPGLNIAKSAVDDEIVGGQTASFEIVVWNAGPGTAHDVMVSDKLPGGLDWAEDSEACSIANGILSCAFGDLGVSSFEQTDARVTVSAETTSEDCGQLLNLAVASASNNEDVDDDATIAVRCPGLVIDKAADREQVDVTAGEDTTVTWTLTYTLTDGPVSNAVISDPIPAGLNYVAGSAAPDAVYDEGTRTLSWTFATLTESGSVSFETTVDASVGGGVTLENVATIDSDETAPDNGADSIKTIEQEEQAATGTPQPSVPNTAFGSTGDGQPLNVPVELMVLVFLASLGGLTLANVKAVRRRR